MKNVCICTENSEKFKLNYVLEPTVKGYARTMTDLIVFWVNSFHEQASTLWETINKVGLTEEATRDAFIVEIVGIMTSLPKLSMSSDSFFSEFLTVVGVTARTVDSHEMLFLPTPQQLQHDMAALLYMFKTFLVCRYVAQNKFIVYVICRIKFCLYTLASVCF